MDKFELIEVRLKPKPTFFGLLAQGEPVTVRRFSDQALQASIDRVLASLPDDRKAAELEIAATPEGVAAVVAVKLSAGWSIRGGIFYDRDRDWGGKVVVRWAGK